MDNDAAPSPTKSIEEQPRKTGAQEAAKSIGGCPEGGDQGVGGHLKRNKIEKIRIRKLKKDQGEGGHLLWELGHLKGRLERTRVGGNKYTACAQALENKTKHLETNCGRDR